MVRITLKLHDPNYTVVCNIRITNKSFTSLEWKSAYYIGLDNCLE